MFLKTSDLSYPTPLSVLSFILNPVIANSLSSRDENSCEEYTQTNADGSVKAIAGGMIFFFIVLIVLYITAIVLVIWRRKVLPTSVIVMTILGCFFIFGFNPLISIILILSFTGYHNCKPSKS